MYKTFRQLRKVLKPEEQKIMLGLGILMMIRAVLQSLSVAAIIPLVTVLMNSGQTPEGTVGQIMDAFLSGMHVQNAFNVLVPGIMLLFLAKNAFFLWQDYLHHRETARIRKRVQNRLLKYYLNKPYQYFLDSDSGDILRTITVDSDYFCSLLLHVLNIFTNGFMVLLLAILVFTLDPKMTLFSMLLLFVEYLIIIRLIRPFLHRYGKKYRKALGRGNGVIMEVLRGIKTIRITGRESFFEQRYAEYVDELSHAKMMELTFSGAPASLMETMTVTALLLFLLIQSRTVGDLSGMIPTFSALGFAILRIMPAISKISSAMSYVGYYEGSLNRVTQICTEMQETAPQTVEKFLRFEKDIRLSDISFAYGPDLTPVLDHASLVIPYHKTIGIKGVSGAGKTTLADILLGLLPPQSGHVFLDGVVQDTGSTAWKQLFAYIPQYLFILSGTIRENIVFGEDEKDFDENRFWQAIDTAQLREFIHSLKMGVNTEVGENGVHLSGGQIQRIGIARALYSDAQVLVFDEATSALDAETEQSLMDAIVRIRGQKTMILIAHRLATIENCDFLYTIRDQTIIPEVRKPLQVSAKLVDDMDMH